MEPLTPRACVPACVALAGSCGEEPPADRVSQTDTDDVDRVTPAEPVAAPLDATSPRLSPALPNVALLTYDAL